MNEIREHRWKSVLFIGAPGTGKGTQSQAIDRLPGYYSFNSGAALRAVEADSELGQKVQGYLRSGDLVPNNLMLDVWRSRMRRAIDQGDFSPAFDLLLLDAFPRDADQVELLSDYVDFQLVIHLQADDEILKTRLQQRDARPDDRDVEVIDHRLKIYHQRTKPLLEKFPADLVATVDAAQPPILVLREVVERFSAMLRD